jgi:threonine/homoserine/homoserine lactone efflux protein
MDPDLLLGLLGFAFVTSVTPGPNNMMLMASGVNFGFRRTLPHMFGVSLGHAAMTALLGLGAAGLFRAFPQANLALKAAATAYMLWLAWKIAHAAAPEGREGGGRPFMFLQAAGFQWVNPKAWAMSLAAVANYAPGQELGAVLWVAAAFAAVNLPSVSLWALLGQEMRRFLGTPKRLRAFNWTMAGLLVASLYPVLTAIGPGV